MCPSCGALNDRAASFCSRCGARVDDLALIDARQRVEDSAGYLPKDLADLFLSPDSGEVSDRRQVTILFVDLVRSTQIVRALGAEDMADLLDDFLDGIASTVTEIGGTVAELAGDGALCLFGAPTLHEDDPERALHAALSIRRLAVDLRVRRPVDAGWQPQVRIGLHTGTVVLRVAGRVRRLGYAPVGDAVHFTKRLESAADPGEILVSAVTRNLTMSLFQFGASKTLKLKGFDEPHVAFPLLGERTTVERRYLKAGETKFVGREPALAVVRSCVENLAVGVGGVLTIWGEAGIGKSRLLAEARRLPPSFRDWLEGRGLSYAQNTPYSIISQQIRRAAGVTEADTERSARERLRTLIVQVCGVERIDAVYPYIATAMGMRLDGRERSMIEKSSSETLQTEILRSIRALVAARTERSPMVLIFEDLHWSDRASIAALDNLLPLAEEQSVLFVIVARPDPDGPSWALRQKIETRYAHCHTALHLGPLSERESSQLAMELLHVGHLSTDLRKLLLEKAEGVPLFLEELTKSLLEQGALRRGGGNWRLAVAPDDLRLPETLQGIILARFDRLDPGMKRTLQAAAVLGPLVIYRVLAILTDSDGKLPIILRDLQRLGFLRETRRTPERVYTFQHALIRDVAYQTMRQRSRKELHQKAGVAMEQAYRERIGEYRGVIAEHFRRAEAWEKATSYLIDAGDESTRLHAHAEARVHYAKAAEALGHLSDTVPNRRRRVDIILKRAAVSYIAEPPEMNLQRLAEGEALARGLFVSQGHDHDDQVRLAWIDYWLGRIRYIAGDPPSAMQNYERALADGRRLGDARLTMMSSAMMGQAFTTQGQWTKAQEHFGSVLPVLEKAGDWREWCLASGYMSVAVAASGQYQRGLALVRSSVKRALELRGGNLIASTRALLCATHLMNEQMYDVARAAQDAVDASERSGEEVVLYIGLGFRGWAEGCLGDHAAAEASMERCHKVGLGLGQLLLADWFAVGEADISLRAGRIDEAIARAAVAVQGAERAVSVYSGGMAHRVWGRASAAADPPDWESADEHLAAALEMLEAGHGRLPAAHTHIAWAEICLARGDAVRAQEHFRIAASRFKGFGLEDEFRRARRAMRGLGSHEPL